MIVAPTLSPGWRFPVALALVALLFGCAPSAPSADQSAMAGPACTATADGFAPDPGMAGTDAPKQFADRGIGGTGAAVRLADRGIGGTGAPVGVNGTITGFASICVNGLEIGYDPTATINVDGVDLPARELRVGQVVDLRADPGSGAMMARDMAVRHAVSGPIEKLSDGGIILVVAGQTVRLGVGSPGADQLRIGQWVEISGLRDPAGVIVAARADLREPGQVVITGHVVGRPGAQRIGGARLRGSLPAKDMGTSISVSGDYANGVLTVHHVIGADRPHGQPRMLYVEAFAKATQTANGAPALQLGDDIIANMAPDFGTAPLVSTLLVLALEQSDTGELTAVAQFSGQGGGASTPTASPAIALAPHATTMTAIAISTTAGLTAAGKGAAVPHAPAKAATTTIGASKAATTAASVGSARASTAAPSGAGLSAAGPTGSGKGGTLGSSGAGGAGGAGGGSSPAKK